MVPSNPLPNPKKVKGVDPTFDYKSYWEERYKRGRNSGAGSYGKNAHFKSDMIKRTIEENNIKSIVDFGCGDGNQISFLPSNIKYFGYDISQTAIDLCNKQYSGRPHWSFGTYDPMTYTYETMADMSMACDILFHVTIEDEWLKTIDCICRSATKIVVLITNAESIREEYFPHVNYKRRILPVLDAREDVLIDEVVTQPTDRESSVIILRKV